MSRRGSRVKPRHIAPAADPAPPAGCNVIRPLPRPTMPRFITGAAADGAATGPPMPFAKGLPAPQHATLSRRELA